MRQGIKSPLKRPRDPFGSAGGGAAFAPVNISVPIISGLPGVGVVLSLTHNLWDGNPTPVLTYVWKRDGAPIGSATNATYTIQVADIGANITCTVTATNSQGSANETTAAIGPVVALPVNNTAPILSGSAIIGQTLTCPSGDWTGADSYTYQWYVDDVLVPGATTYQYVLDEYAVLVYCEVTAINTGGSASVDSNEVGPVASLPINTGAPVVSGTAAAGSTLTRTTGTWTGYPASFTYATVWYADDVAISGETGSTLLVTSAMAGKAINCTVAATNSTGTATAVASNGTALVTSAPDFTIDPVLSATGIVSVGEDLTVTTVGLYAYPAPTLTYVWYADGLVIPIATSAVYTLTAAEEGDDIEVVVTATNIHGSDNATTNTLGPVEGPEPTPQEWDFVTENNIILSAEDGESLVNENATTDILHSLVITPIAGGKSASFTVGSRSTVGTAHMIAVPTATPTPSNGDIKDWATNGTGPIVWGASLTLTAMTDGTPGIMPLTQLTAYDFYMVLELSATPGDFSNTVTAEFTTLDAAPELSDLRVTAISTTQCNLSFVTDDNLGDASIAIYPTAATPSDGDIVIGTGATAFVEQAISDFGVASKLNFGTLAPGTAYKAYVIQIDSNANISNTLVSAEFSTPAAQSTIFQSANAGVIGSLVTTVTPSGTITVTNSQPDPLGGNNAIKLGHDPGGTTKICSVTRIINLNNNAVEVQAYVKKREWASSQAWLRWRAMNTDVTPPMMFNLDDGTFASVDARITNYIAIPTSDDFWFLKFSVNLDGPNLSDDTNGSYLFYFARSSSDASIQTSGLHAIDLFDYKIVSH